MCSQAGEGIRDEEIGPHIDRYVRQRFGADTHVDSLRGMPFQDTSTAECDVISVDLSSGGTLRLFLKKYGQRIDRRVNPEQSRRRKRQREVFAYRTALPQIKVGTPEFVAASLVDDENKEWLLIEAISGTTVAHFGVEYWYAAASWLAKFHEQVRSLESGALTFGEVRFDHRHFSRVANEMYALVRERYPEISPSVLGVRDRVLSLADTLMDDGHTWVHGDFSHHNILIRSGDGQPSSNSVCPVDWEGFGLGSTLFDLSQFSQGYKPKDLERFVESYREEAGQLGLEVLPAKVFLRKLYRYRSYWWCRRLRDLVARQMPGAEASEASQSRPGYHRWPIESAGIRQLYRQGMRYCLVSYEYPPETADGGIGTQTWNKAQGLTRLGHSVDVLSCAAGAIEEPMATTTQAGVRVHRMRRPGDAPPGVPLLTQPAFLLGYSWAVLECLTRLRPRESFDLVNFPEYGAEGAAFLLNRTVENWVPAIVHLHAPLAMLAERMGWPEKESSFYRTAAVLEGEAIRLADGWMASSANIADWVSGFYGTPREKIDVVHCGIDTEVFSPDAGERLPGHRHTVLFVGTISKAKGVKTVFEAVMGLRERHPEILLQVVGRQNDLTRRLASKAEAAGASRNLELIPFVEERSEIVSLYQGADVFASPCDNENGVANVYVEAMSCGCPVVVADTGGSAEAVVEGDTGFLVPPRDVGVVARAIDRILSNEELRERLGEGARQRVESYFAQDRYIERVLAAYERAMAASAERVRELEGAV